MAQKLITAEVKKFLKKHPSGSQDGLNEVMPLWSMASALCVAISARISRICFI